MPWTLNGDPAPRHPSNGWLMDADGLQFPPEWPASDLVARGFVWIDPEPVASTPRRVTKARFGDLFSDDEHAATNLLRWQCAQMDAEDRAVPGNPLVYAETLFRKLELPAEFIELDIPMVADWLGLLGMLGVFGDSATARIAAILADDDPT